MNQEHPQPVTLWEDGVASTRDLHLLGEEPLAIRVDGKPYAVVMRTPGDEIAHAAGFSLGEGIIDSVADASAIALCEGEAANVVTVTLSVERRAMVGNVLDRRNYISQTSCGICGKELVEDLFQLLRPVRSAATVDLGTIRAGMEAMADRQTLRRKTRASHAAALCDPAGRPIALAEDIGRHNALDKAIGQALLGGTLADAAMAILSSRISYELVQKAARAGVPVMFSVSRPTGLAVDLARRLNMTVACLAPGNGIYVFCGRDRLKGP